MKVTNDQLEALYYKCLVDNFLVSESLLCNVIQNRDFYIFHTIY